GLAFAQLTLRARTRTANLSFAAVATAIVVESAFHMPLVDRPPPVRALEYAPPGAALEIPAGDTEHDTPAMYRSMFHRRPLLNGASGFSPPHYEVLSVALDDEDEGALDEIATTPLVVAVDITRALGSRWVELLGRRPGARSLGVEAGEATFWIPATARERERPVGARLAI